jgi:tetratricopeptide (TPR) repeat protein
MADAYAVAAGAQRDLGLLDAALVSWRAVVALHGRSGRSASVELTAALVELGDLLRFRGEFAEAESVLTVALTSIPNNDTIAARPIRARVLNALGITYKDTARYHAANSAYEEALSLVIAWGGGNHPAAASLWHNMAGLALARGQPSDALIAANLSIELRRRANDPQHRLVALDLAVRGAALLDLGRIPEAERDFEAALETFRGRHPADRYEVAVNLSNLAACRLKRHDAAEAEALFRQALDTKYDILGLRHPEIARQLHNLAVAVAAQGRQIEAHGLQRRAGEIAARALPPCHPLVTLCVRHPMDEAREQESVGTLAPVSVTPLYGTRTRLTRFPAAALAARPQSRGSVPPQLEDELSVGTTGTGAHR